MRLSTHAVVLLACMAAMPARSQTPAGTDPDTGARPGNDIGTGNSLPRSDRASNIVPGDTTSTIAPNLPSPALDPDAPSRDYLKAARDALAAGQTGLAQQALEMAETRELDRSVLQSETDYRSDSTMVFRIAEARRALGSGNQAQALQIIDGTLDQ